MRMYLAYHSIDCLTSAGAKINVNPVISNTFFFLSYISSLENGDWSDHSQPKYIRKLNTKNVHVRVCVHLHVFVYKKQIYREDVIIQNFTPK